jgi:PAS domain S-box-containing protein
MQTKNDCNEDNLPKVEIGTHCLDSHNIKHVLHVDDDLCLLNISKSILELDGEYLIDCALSVDEAFSKLSLGDYDAIISDYEMPIKDGLMFLKILRDYKNEIPFVLFTGRGREEVAIQALNLGADAYINKQGNPETVYGELKHALQNFIEKSEAKKRLAEVFYNYGQAIKALSCLYDISLIVEEPNVSLEAVMQKINDLLPNAYQYPEVACSKITFKNQKYMTNNFRQTSWKQQANILCFGKIAGSVEVCYLEKKNMRSTDEPFLREERLLIDTVAERLGRIAERKENENMIRCQANLLDNVGQSIIMVDENRRILFWNKGAENLYGWCEKDVLGQDILDVTGNAKFSDSEKVMQRLKSGESWSIETKVTRKDGSDISVILNRSPLFGEGGKYCGAVSVVTDISELKRIERDLSIALEGLSFSIDNAELLNEKLRVIGGLTRHDVRNKLSGVAGYCYLIRKKHEDEPDIVKAVDQINLAIKKIIRIFDFSKMYEDVGTEKLTSVNAGSAVADAIKLFSVTPNFRVINGCHGLNLVADSFLVQLFYNLLENTQKYGQTVTEVNISYEECKNGDLKLIYEDNGVGISSDEKQFLFREGRSTGGSTGLGLFFIKRMLDVYGWQIQETGTPGKCAKFVITIPKQSVAKTSLN